MSAIRCAQCHIALDEAADGTPRTPCPACGATSREMDVEIHEQVQVRDSWRAVGKRPGFGMLFDSFSGADFGKTAQRWFEKLRLIDPENNDYYEKVWDPETGEIIHECHEPLSEHTGHGSAKKK